MLALRQLWFLQRDSRSLQCYVPAIAGGSLLCASFLPWLKDPLGAVYTPWNLPIDIGWQFRISILNYGLFCLCCAIYALLVAYANWRPFRGHTYFVQRQTIVGLLCMLPVALFLLQYLCIDVQAITRLASHKTQELLIQRHFGYTVTRQLILLDPFTLNVSTFWGRLQLLIDQLSFGPLLPCITAWLVLDYRRLFRILPTSVIPQQRRHPVRNALGLLLLLVVFGRAPAGMVCEYEAKTSLSSGDYTQALQMLDVAQFLQPNLEQVAYYHMERGQALYFLSPGQLTDDSRAYLASTYSELGDYLDAYQQQQAVLNKNPTVPWAIDEMSLTLTKMSEFTPSSRGLLIQRTENDDSILPWLKQITSIDSSNIYGLYMTGRIQYNLHNYAECQKQMSQVLT